MSRTHNFNTLLRTGLSTEFCLFWHKYPQLWKPMLLLSCWLVNTLISYGGLNLIPLETKEPAITFWLWHRWQGVWFLLLVNICLSVYVLYMNRYAHADWLDFAHDASQLSHCIQNHLYLLGIRGSTFLARKQQNLLCLHQNLSLFFQFHLFGLLCIFLIFFGYFNKICSLVKFHKVCHLIAWPYLE